ncbi:hypothetical protein [Rugamonas sp. DEMB1]|uniref:hypothetical protein n=1 Tax=Rugamonas sp. DEMB1 TaxID=3039386 RepID=UPI00244BAC4E|nr:hypothetical protein [Rugamonas sp. DEMB1]WGG53654.1 hypothetical protein QC826_14845 [Rugamonas sp. DEMB1]
MVVALAPAVAAAKLRNLRRPAEIILLPSIGTAGAWEAAMITIKYDNSIAGLILLDQHSFGWAAGFYRKLSGPI